MFILISPAKTLDFDSKSILKEPSEVLYQAEAYELVKKLQSFSETEIASLMKLSDKLSKLNKERYSAWQKIPKDESTKTAIEVFKGDVYQGLAIENYESDDFDFAQKHLRILSGLYGILRPLDKIQAYRLEMGTKLAIGSTKNLYEYWREKVTAHINKSLKDAKNSLIINLASNEYFKVVDKKLLDKNIEIVTPIFKDYKNDEYKVISFYAKKARGLMSSFIIKNQITKAEDIKKFDIENYQYNENLSNEKEWVFTR